tara:strand:- start:382 stop:597 length:216 start_codon:yes stop_codon:yes gene_type:complete
MSFPKTKRTDMDLALTRFGDPDLFDDTTLERIEKQNLSFLKPKIDINKMKFITLIPLAIIGLLLYSRVGRK